MARPFKDLTGQPFGRLTALERARPAPSGNGRWICGCRCSDDPTAPVRELTVVLHTHLTGHKIRSCGCLRVEHGRRQMALMHARLAAKREAQPCL